MQTIVQGTRQQAEPAPSPLDFGGPPDNLDGGGVNFGDLRAGFMNFLMLFIKWFWLFLIIIGIALSAAYVLNDRAIPVYKAQTTLEVKQSAANVLDVSGVEQIVVNNEFMETQILLLSSTAIAKSVVESLNLYSIPDYANQSLGLEQRINEAAGRIQNNLNITPQGRSRIIRMTINDTDPARASNILNTLSQNFINYNYEKSYATTSSARDFVEERLAATKIILEKTERELANFAEENRILDLSGGGAGNATSGSLSETALFALNDELAQIQLEAFRLKQRYEQVRANPESGDVLSNPVIIDLKTQKRALEGEYTQNLQVMKPGFPDMIELSSQIDLLEQQILTETENVIRSIRLEYEQADSLQKQLTQQVSSLKNDIRNEQNNSIDYNILVREVETNRTQYEGLLQRLKDLTVTDGIAPNLISIVDPALPPKSPISPNLFRSLIFALILGTGLATLIVFILEIIDDRIKNPQDVTSKVGVPLLGVIPALSKGESPLTQLDETKSSLSEAISSIRTVLIPAISLSDKNSVHVTSTRSSEGKSLVAYALAKSFADMGKRTVIIDADMRKPAFKGNGENTMGLAELLINNSLMKDNVQSTKQDNLFLLPCLTRPENPSVLLSNPRFIDIVAQAKKTFDVVIIDSPPVLGIADAPTIGSIADYSIFVIEYSGVRTPVVKNSVSRLKSSRTNLIGAVLNKYKSPTNSYLDYYYYSYGENSGKYGDEPSGRRRRLSEILSFKKRRDKLDI